MRPTDLCFDLVRKLPPDVQAKLASVPGWDRYSDPENGPPRLVEAGCEVPADPLDIVRIAAEIKKEGKWIVGFDGMCAWAECGNAPAAIAFAPISLEPENPHLAALLMLANALGMEVQP